MYHVLSNLSPRLARRLVWKGAAEGPGGKVRDNVWRVYQLREFGIFSSCNMLLVDASFSNSGDHFHGRLFCVFFSCWFLNVWLLLNEGLCKHSIYLQSRAHPCFALPPEGDMSQAGGAVLLLSTPPSPRGPTALLCGDTCLRATSDIKSIKFQDNKSSIGPL